MTEAHRETALETRLIFPKRWTCRIGLHTQVTAPGGYRVFRECCMRVCEDDGSWVPMTLEQVEAWTDWKVPT